MFVTGYLVHNCSYTTKAKNYTMVQPIKSRWVTRYRNAIFPSHTDTISQNIAQFNYFHCIHPFSIFFLIAVLFGLANHNKRHPESMTPLLTQFTILI